MMVVSYDENSRQIVSAGAVEELINLVYRLSGEAPISLAYSLHPTQNANKSLKGLEEIFGNRLECDFPFGDINVDVTKKIENIPYNGTFRGRVYSFTELRYINVGKHNLGIRAALDLSNITVTVMDKTIQKDIKEKFPRVEVNVPLLDE